MKKEIITNKKVLQIIITVYSIFVSHSCINFNFYIKIDMEF